MQHLTTGFTPVRACTFFRYTFLMCFSSVSAWARKIAESALGAQLRRKKEELENRTAECGFGPAAAFATPGPWRPRSTRGSSSPPRSPLCISLTPARLDRYPRGFTGHVAHPSRSIHSRTESFVCSRNWPHTRWCSMSDVSAFAGSVCPPARGRASATREVRFAGLRQGEHYKVFSIEPRNSLLRPLVISSLALACSFWAIFLISAGLKP